MQLAELNQLVAEGIASGEVKPLPVTVFQRNQIEEAFRYMASGLPSFSLFKRTIMSLEQHQSTTTEAEAAAFLL